MKKKSLKFAATVALSVLALLSPRSAPAQSTLVRPRITNIVTSLLLTPKQVLNTNATLPTQAVAGWAPTLVPAVGVHPVGLTATLTVSNAMASVSSNLVINVYGADDIGGGNTTGIGTAYGTNFATNVPLLTWTISYTNSGIWNTNIAPSGWEPATSLGYTINNQNNSNIVLTLQQSQAP